MTTPEAPSHSYEARLSRVLAHIYDNLDGDLSLDAMADVACLSRFHFHRVFRAMTGQTLAEAIRRIRLFAAAKALVDTTAPVSEIAARVGYPNLAAFTRAFSALLGASPAAFRKARGLPGAVPIRSHGAIGMYPVTLQTFESLRAAGVAHSGPYPGIGKAFQKLGAIIASRGLIPRAAGMVAVYHDDPGSKPDEDLSSHAAVVLGEGFPPDIPGLDYFELAGGRYAVLEHRGSYATLCDAYDWLYGEWLPKSGVELRDAPPYELYVNNPQSTPVDQLRTEIRLPLV